MVALFSLLLLFSVTVTAQAELLYFGATWCQPCQAMKPALHRLQREGHVIRSIDIDRQPELARRFQVSAVPCFIRVDARGNLISRIDQATTYEALREMLAQPSRPSTVPAAASRFAGVRPAPSPQGQPLLQTASNAHATNAAAARSPQTQQQGNLTAVESAARAASVRLRVEDATGHSYGTGTVIDLHGKEALVLTCAHIFRDSGGKGRITIDRYDHPSARPLEGSLISYDLDLDVALVSVGLDRPIAVAPLADPQTRPLARSAVFSVGCNHGEPPTVVRGHINQVNKYLGPANITASGRPVDGRSGGGLFLQDGTLLGVCNAADPELDEGLYAALPRVCRELDRNGLAFVYQTTASSTELAVAEPPRPLVSPAAAAPATPHANIQQASFEAPMDGRTATPPGSTSATPSAPRPMPPAGQLSRQELVCVLRSAEGGNKTFVISSPSRVLLEYLERETQPSR